MNIKPISYKNMESKTKDIYETVVVISKRASQILHDRLVERMIRENGLSTFFRTDTRTIRLYTLRKIIHE